MRPRLPAAIVLFLLPAPAWAGPERFELTTTADTPTRTASTVVSTSETDATSFLVEFEIDPTAKPDGDHQAVAGFTLGLGDGDDPLPGSDSRSVSFELREGATAGFWDVWIHGVNEPRREPRPRPPGWTGDRQYQQPWEFTPHDGPYRLRVVGTPRDSGTLLRFFFEHLDRPVFEFASKRRITLGRVGVYAVTGGTEPRSNRAVYQLTACRRIEPAEVVATPTVADVVLDALDLTRPELASVRATLQRDDRRTAARLLVEHFRERKTPVGPPLTEQIHSPNYLEVADAALEDRYGTLGPSAKLSATYVDGAGNTQRFVDEKGVIRWAYCHGHLTRHFHWCSLAKAHEETGNAAYAKRFAREVTDWVAREPFLHPRNPDIGGLNWMDGTTFVRGYMNTSNIGRRCELTWWPAFESFRHSADVDEGALLHMLLGFVRQSRLLMNPSSFAAHDDGGSHGAVALLQNGLMLPEFRESARWREEAARRLDVVLDVQFYPDGSHASLSTGYNWASIKSLENLVALYRRTGQTVPRRFLDTLERAYRHPILTSRPNRGQIDLNDGGWGMIDDHMRRAHELFPHRDDFRWMGTRGEKGKPPRERSAYFPNAGHFVLRTGWGPQHRYLFMDAGPVGASHGKEDKLGIYVDHGGHPLLASGGRGSYAGGPFTAYTGSTRGYNTLLVDGGVQARIPHRFEIYGHEPETRRFEDNEHFGYAEGFHTHGWYAPGNSVQGRQTRQVVFVKGTNPPETAYWIVVDTVEPADDEEHAYEALFHVRRNHAEVVDAERKIVRGWDAAAALRIVPAVTADLEVELVHGQTEPHVQGWHVVGKARAPMWTPVFRWKAKGPTTRAWVLVPAGPEQKWCVENVTSEWPDDGTLVVRCRRPDGGFDELRRRTPDADSAEPDVVVRSFDETSRPSGELAVRPTKTR